MTTDIKIKEELWNLIVSGEKTTEFRKLCKGYKKGTYRFVSVEKYKQYLTSYKDIPGHKTKDGRIILGLAKLKPIAVNPPFSNTDAWNDNKLLDDSMYFCSSNYASWNNVCDKESYKFLKQHYIDKHDFVAYNITDVKDLR